jgi:hypothetical protein
MTRPRPATTVTLRLSSDLLEIARVVAQRHGTSLSSMVERGLALVICNETEAEESAAEARAHAGPRHHLRLLKGGRP